MTDYDAGRARAELILDLTKYEQSIARAKQLMQEINKTPTLGTSSGGSTSNAATQQRSLSNSILQTANAQARLAQVQNTGKNAAIGLAQAEQVYINALKQIPSGTNQATKALTNLQIVQNRLKNVSGGGGPALPRTLEEFGGTALNQLKASFLGVLGPAALVTGAIGALRGAVAGAGEAIEESLALKATKNSLAAVSGDFKTYNVIMAEARNQQILFGGSLNENLEGLQGMATVAKATGADLGTLIDLQKRLTLLNNGPTGGAQGARIALANALSGQVTSLQRRFDIPVDQLKGLNDTSKSTAERLAIVSTFLDKVGISSAAVETRVDQNAKAFNRFNQEIGDAKINVGNALATVLAPMADKLATIVGILNNNPEAWQRFDRLISGPTKGNDPNNKEALENIRLGLAQRTTQKQISQIDTLSPFDTLLSGSDRLGSARNEVENLLGALNNAGGRAAELGQGLTDAFSNDKRAKTEDYIASLKKLVAQSVQVKGAIDDNKDALLDEIHAKIVSKQHTQDLANLQRQLGVDSKLAAQGLLGAGNQAELLALKYNLATGEAQHLIDQQLIILNQGSKINTLPDLAPPKATPEQTAAGLADQRAGERTGTTLSATEFQAQANIAADIRERKRQEAEAAAKEAARIQDAANALALEKATTHQAKIAELQKQLGQTTDEADRLNIQRDIQREQNALASEKERKLKGVSSELNKQVGLEERIHDSLEKQQKTMLDIEELTIRNRQETRKEEKDIAQAQRILKDPRKAKLFDSASDQLALIDVERRKRDFEIQDKQSTVAGTIFNGRILQSRPGSGAVPTQQQQAVGAVPTATPSQAARTRATSALAQQVVRFIVTDPGFKVIAEHTGPLIFADATIELDRVANAGTSGNTP